MYNSHNMLLYSIVSAFLLKDFNPYLYFVHVYGAYTNITFVTWLIVHNNYYDLRLMISPSQEFTGFFIRINALHDRITRPPVSIARYTLLKVKHTSAPLNKKRFVVFFYSNCSFLLNS